MCESESAVCVCVCVMSILTLELCIAAWQISDHLETILLQSSPSAIVTPSMLGGEETSERLKGIRPIRRSLSLLAQVKRYLCDSVFCQQSHNSRKWVFGYICSPSH